jgi:isoleucyl-tRNA synthetase
MVRLICSAGLSIRKKHNLRTRLPLLNIKIITAKTQTNLTPYLDLIKDELNVKDAIIIEASKDSVKETIKINFKTCGKKLGSNLNKIISLANLGQYTKLPNGSLAFEGGVVIEACDYESFIFPASNYNPSTEDFEAIKDFGIVILNKQIDETLEIEAIARDIVRVAQNARKSEKLNITDKISVHICSTDVLVKQALNGHFEYIKEQILASDISFSEELKDPEAPFTLLVKKS